MESSKLAYYTFKYSLLGIAIILGIAAIVSWIQPDSMGVNEQPVTPDLFTTTIYATVSLLALVLFFAIKEKFATVALGNQTIKIMHHGVERTVSWLDVEKIELIQFVNPPLYRLKIKNEDEVIWFNTTQRNYFSFLGSVSDLSDMAMLIEKKKHELGI